MSSRHIHFSHSVIVEVIRAIVSRPMNSSHRSTGSRCCLSKSAWPSSSLLLWQPRPLSDLYPFCQGLKGSLRPGRRTYSSRSQTLPAEDCEQHSSVQEPRPRTTVVPKTTLPKATANNPRATVVKVASDGTPVIVRKNKLKKPKREGYTLQEYNKAIAFATMEDRVNKAIELLKEMEEKGIEPDKATYTMIINAFCKNSDMTRARKWFRRMQANGVAPDVYTYTSLIDGYMRIADIEQCEYLFRQMMKADIRPNIVTYNTLMHHSVMQLDLENAVNFWKRLLDAGLDPDVYTFAIMIHGFGDSGRVDEAWRLFGLMQKKNISVNEVVANTLMGMHVKHKDNTYALRLFHKFFRTEDAGRRLQETPYTKNILLNAVIGNADAATIKRYYDQFLLSLEDKEVQAKSHLFSGANVFTYTSFMRAFLRRDALPMVSQVYQDMKARNVKPTMVTYAILMLAHAYIPDPYSCVSILQELKKHGFQPNAVHYNIVMRAWAKAGRFEEMRKTYNEMKADNIKPDMMTMNILQWGKGRRKE